jgi:hypothetical protein
MQLTVAQSTKPQHSMESEGSLMCSQEPATGSYPAPAESSPIFAAYYWVSDVASLHFRLFE